MEVYMLLYRVTHMFSYAEGYNLHWIRSMIT